MSPLVQSPTTPGQYDLIQNTLVPSADWPPPANWAYLYRALLHQDSITSWRMQRNLVPTDPSQVTLSVHSPTTPQQYYLLRNAYIPRGDAPHQAQVYSSLPHQNSINYWQMQTYPGHMDSPTPHELNPSVQSPTIPQQYDIAQCRCTQCQSTPQHLLIKPSVTETYYSRAVWHCRMQMYPLLI